MATTETQDPKAIIYSRFDSYPFAADAEFQQGLNSILSANPDADEGVRSELALKAKVYYFAR
jgi:hypothetical protein